jgi:hypothetical protein
MFTKNKILLGLALALFTFAAPSRAQEPAPFFFSTQVFVGNSVFYSPDFGYYNWVNYPWIYKFGFGWLWYGGNDASGGSFLYDWLTGGFFWTNAQVYEYPQAAYFYSYNLGTWLYYYEDSDDNNRRTFYNYATGMWIYYP